ncbi:hypothetical protein GCM10027589_03640 [Actinocorallia lasiicapitis]
MGLTFVGKDPGSPLEKCPAIFVAPDTGDFFFQGRIVNDPAILAEIEGHSPRGADEMVVWLPARMAGMLAEAALGSRRRSRIGADEVSLFDLLRGARRSVYRLQSRDSYDTSSAAFQEWVAGGSGVHDRAEWVSLVGGLTERGVDFRRLRVVSEPVSDYVRWEHSLMEENIAAGESVAWLPRRQSFDLLLPTADLWLIDGRVVAFDFHRGDGSELSDELFVSDNEVVARCRRVFDRAWRRAVPHADYDPR